MTVPGVTIEHEFGLAIEIRGATKRDIEILPDLGLLASLDVKTTHACSIPEHGAGSWT